MKNWITRRYALCLLFLGYFALRFLYRDFVPIWDARTYYNHICLAVHAPFDLLNYCPWDHSSFFSFMLHGTVERLWPGDVVAWNLSLIAVSWLGIYGFYRAVKRLAGGSLSETEAVLMTALFAFQPAILANNINFGLDLGVMSFYFMFLWLWNEERFAWAAMFAMGMFFTKEPGLLLFGSTILISFIIWLAQKPRPLVPAALAWLKHRWVCLVVPPLAFALYVSYRVFIRHTIPIFYLATPGVGLVMLYLNFLNVSAYVRTSLALMLLLSFSWTLLIPSATGALTLLFSGRRQRLAATHRGFIQSLLLLLLISYLLSRFTPVSNIRYFMLGTGLSVLCCSLALEMVLPRGPSRPLVLVLFLGLFLLGDFRSADPVSRLIFGTIHFGEHPLYRVNSLTRECCGIAGRDQLVYNLEFTKLQSVQNKIYESIRPTSDTYILSDSQATFFTTDTVGAGTLSPNQLYYEGSLLSGQLDPVSFHRTLQTVGSILPKNGSFVDLQGLQTKPDLIYYLAYPLFDNRFELQSLAALYPVRVEQTFDDDGYRIDLYRFSKR